MDAAHQFFVDTVKSNNNFLILVGDKSAINDYDKTMGNAFKL